ncbi:MAG: hypothetical protein M3Y50_01640 [Acidobacteriota bacterium]|nr:hypothetical protein [Acidobacteriota bacterium]
MLIPLTIAALLVVTAAMVAVRLLWERLPPGVRTFLPRAAVAVIVVQLFFSVTKWGTTSTYVNVWINWMAIAAYELLVLLFSRLPPRWLTSLSAFILLVPLFASTILLPLTGVFRRGSITKQPVGENLYYKVVPWSNNGLGNSGVDVDVYYRPRFAPFLSRRIKTQAFNTQECNATKAMVEPGPRSGTVVARCPHWPVQPAGTEDKLLDLGAR